MDQPLKLIIFSVLCLLPGTSSSEWVNYIDSYTKASRKKKDGVRMQHISTTLDLRSDASRSNLEAVYNLARRNLEQHLDIAAVSSNSLLKQFRKDLKFKLGKHRRQPEWKQRQSRTYYIFVSEGLGTWLVQHVVSDPKYSKPESSVYRRIVGLFFLQQTSGAGLIGGMEAIRNYLDSLSPEPPPGSDDDIAPNKVFAQYLAAIGRISECSLFGRGSWTFPVASLFHHPTKTPTTPTLAELLLESTELAVSEHKARIKAKNHDSPQPGSDANAHKSAPASGSCAEEPNEATILDDRLKSALSEIAKLRIQSKRLEAKRSVSSPGFRFLSPRSPQLVLSGSNTTNSSTVAYSASLTSFGVSDHLSGKPQLFESVYEEGIKSLTHGDVKLAREHFVRCMRILNHTILPGLTLSTLRVELALSVANIALGNFYEALQSLRNVRRALQHILDDYNADDLELASKDEVLHLERFARYRFATLLFRIAAFDGAKELLRKPDWDDLDHAEIWQDDATVISFNDRWNKTLLLIGVYRLRSLLAAMMGDFQSAQSDLSDSENICKDLNLKLKDRKDIPGQDLPVCQVQLTTTELSVQLARANLLTFRGDYRRALDEVNLTLEKLRSVLKPGNSLILEAAVLKAFLISRTSGAGCRDGEDAATEIKLAISKYLDPNHPFAFEAEYCRILSLKSQGKLEEALEHSRHLCWEAGSSTALGVILIPLPTVTCNEGGADSGLDPNNQQPVHPQTIKYNNQRGWLEFYMGSYNASCRILRQAAERSLENWAKMPVTAKYLADRAFVNIRLGRLELAEQDLLRAVQLQFTLYAPDLECPTTIRDRALIEQLRRLNRSVGTSYAATHPDLLFTLYNIGILLSEMSPLHFAADLIPLVLDSCKAILGEYHEWTLLAALTQARLFLRISEADPDHEGKVGNALSLLSYVERAAGSERPNHPLALSAEREFLHARILNLNPTSPEETKRVFRKTSQALRRIADLQERHLGPEHPDRHKTLVSLLLVTVLLEYKSRETWDNLATELLQSLRSPKVRRQRYMESVLVELEVAEIFYNAEILEKCSEVLGDVKKSIASESTSQVQEDEDGFLKIDTAVRSLIEKRILHLHDLLEEPAPEPQSMRDGSERLSTATTAVPPSPVIGQTVTKKRFELVNASRTSIYSIRSVTKPTFKAGTLSAAKQDSTTTKKDSTATKQNASVPPTSTRQATF
ncbi:hypothetical protein QBC44DRAFT_372740 [Cladorrhinum sp. PSN332]|nr:hypothetical protein QBC44DRAFT_372740 [Cladorrhinum sp. PSN332]